MASDGDGSSSEPESGMHCVTCGIHEFLTPRRWECDVCPDYIPCENCYKGPPYEVHCRDHPMSTHVLTFTCDGCGSTPIWNRRWQCTICVDFSLCKACCEGLDAANMPLEHLEEHPMIAVEVICLEKLLSFEPSFTKPVDSQWSYLTSVDSQSYGFMWEKRKPKPGSLSGMDDAIVPAERNAIEDNNVPISKQKVCSN